MTLQRKFVLLIALLALVIAASGGAAYWSFTFLRREIGLPFHGSITALGGLSDIRNAVLLQARRLCPAEFPPAGAAAEPERDAGVASFGDEAWFDPAIQRAPIHAGTAGWATDERELVRTAQETIAAAVDALEHDSWYPTRVGGSSWRNLTDRLKEASERVDLVLAFPGEESNRLRLAESFRLLLELVERTEARLLIDAENATIHGELIQKTLVAWLGSVLLLGLLSSVLAVILLRRWVQLPVSALRDAAAHIARGDLTYRLRSEGRDELALLSREVNHMAEMIHQMQEERVERERLAAIGGMVRRLVHNVRNPLAGIRGLAELTRLDTPQGSESRDNLDLIVTTVDTFERWLSEVLEATSPTQLNVRQTQLRAWAKGVIEVHRPLAQSKGVELTMIEDDAPDQAVFDPSHLEHALAAIVSNAIEATPEYGRVWVRLSTLDADKWEVAVADTGPGVRLDVAVRIFEPHFTTKRHGTGMGLALAQQVIRAHGGKIGVESGISAGFDSSGACFTIRMPLVAVPQ